MITVLTVTRRPQHAPRYIESIAAQDFDGIVRHIVVVDGDPQVRQVIDDEEPPYPLEVIFVPRSASDADGPARLAVLRNLAAKAAGAGFVAFHDDDNTWEADHLSSLWQTRIDEGADTVHSERKVFESSGEPCLRPEFPWGRDVATRRAIYAYCLEAGIMERGSNVMHDRFEMRFTWIDLGEWLFPSAFLIEHPFQERYTAWDWYNISVEDRELPRAIYESGLRVASTRKATLNYYLGGYTNLYEGDGLIWRRPGVSHPSFRDSGMIRPS
ncbi:MAG: glycosyltransferase family 2 protein [Mycobacterium sp.]